MKKIRVSFLAVSGTLLLCACNNKPEAPRLNAKAQEAVNNIATLKRIYDKGVFLKHTYYYRELESNTSYKNLILLTNSMIPTVKVYALTALTNKGNGCKGLKAIMLNHINDTTRIATTNGACIYDNIMVNSYMLETLNPVWKGKSHLTVAEYDSIAKLIY